MRTLGVALGILCSILALTWPVSPSAWAQDVYGVMLGTIPGVGAILAERDDGTAAGTVFVASDPAGAHGIPRRARCAAYSR